MKGFGSDLALQKIKTLTGNMNCNITSSNIECSMTDNIECNQE